MIKVTTARHFTRMTATLLLCAGLGACSTLSVPGAGDVLNNGSATTPTAPRPAPDARGVISYPGYQVAVARNGDTVASIAQRLGLDATALARKNGLPETAELDPGEIVILSSRVPESASGSVDLASLAGSALDRAEGKPTAQSTSITAAGPEPRRHTVVAGETAFSIARSYNVSAQALSDWNGLDSNLTVRVGQILLIPPATGPAPQPEADSVTTPGSGSPTPVPPSAATPQPAKDLAPVASGTIATSSVDSTPAPAAQQQTSASDTAALLQPVTGRIIRGYAPGKNEGLDFGTAAGASVRAADAGTVAAITRDTDEVPILVLRHDSNLLTVYANVDDIVVEKGTRVTRGQKIAKVRDGDQPFLHFEVRKGFESVDPVPYLSN